MQETAHELEVMARRAHHSRDGRAPRANLQRRFDDDVIRVRLSDSRVHAFDGDIADTRHSSHVACISVMRTSKGIIPIERIERSILLIRGEKVMLDSSLATLYGVELRALNQAVKRNAMRFPADFMFQLEADEHASLRSQSVILDKGRGAHRKYPPYAFTELGVAMLSSVLRSERAIRVNIDIMRTFVQLRRLLADNVELRQKLEALEKKYDKQFTAVFAAIRKLIDPDDPTTPTAGFAR